MVQTRSQAGNIAIKEEEEERKPTLLLNGVATRRSARITKRRPPVTNNRPSPAQQVKVEQVTNTKALLNSTPKSSNSAKTQKISQEQIDQLIHYIVNDNMKITKASRKVEMHHGTATYYYSVYKNDPEKRIPVPRGSTPIAYTQDQIEKLIRYIEHDSMSVSEASAKANMAYRSAYYYYGRYLKDPDYNIPKLQFQQSYTQDQKNELIGYIVNDKLNITAAAKKAKISLGTAQRYYRKYFKEENHGIATPSHIIAPKCYTQETIKEVIGYIIDDKMSIAAASRKANIGHNAARRYYRQYIKDNNIKFSVPRKVLTQEEIKQFIGYIVDDKMTISEASEKASMNVNTASKYYCKYLKNHNLDLRPRKCTQNQINELIGYIVDAKMTLEEASRKANMCAHTGRKYYRKYLKERNVDYSIRKHITQEQVSQLLGYIVDGEMSIHAASKKANMDPSTAGKHYRQYLKDNNMEIPVGYYCKHYTQKEKDDKMSIATASKKVNMCGDTGYEYYRAYLKDQKL